MFRSQASRVVRQQWRLYRDLNRPARNAFLPLLAPAATRAFHATKDLRIVKPVVLADIGEGMHGYVCICQALPVPAFF